MTAFFIDGRARAQTLYRGLTERIARLGMRPALAVILVGDDPASQVYVSAKERACAAVGITSRVIRLPADTDAPTLEATIDSLNADPAIHGILLQMPLPVPLSPSGFLSRIDPAKDVDGLTPLNLGFLFAGVPRLVPCTPQGVMILIRDQLPDLRGRHAVIVGRSVLVGRPLAQLLLMADCTVTIAHSKTNDLAQETRRADILVSAVGHPGLITGNMVKQGAVVIDVGITRTEGGLKGDIHFASVAQVAGALTPVPGGVGPMTIACLLENTVLIAEKCRP